MKSFDNCRKCGRGFIFCGDSLLTRMVKHILMREWFLEDKK